MYQFLLRHCERRNKKIINMVNNGLYFYSNVTIIFLLGYYKGRNGYVDYKYGKQCIGFSFKGHELYYCYALQKQK